MIPGDTFLKANCHTLGHLNALLVFCGEGIAGHAIISGSQEHFTHLCQQLFAPQQEFSPTEMEDVAQEIANMILGRFKLFFSRYGLPFELGSPVCMRNGAAFDSRVKVGHPSVVLPFSDGTHTLYVEFCIDILDPTQLEKIELDTAEPGELTFL
jgi:CheY-specific phosphatase CheX